MTTWAGDFTDEEWLWAMRSFAPETPIAEVRAAVVARRGSKMTDEELDAAAEGIARAFHQTYETLAPSFGYATRKASAVPWEQVPDANKNLMIAVVRSLLEAGVITAGAS